MRVICCDLEGVFLPEIWINVAEKTGIEELRLTTRDEPNYDVLMKKRLAILERECLKLKDIQDVIATMDPIPGAKDFLDWLRERTQVFVLSDTFLQFADPLMKKLGRPTLLCNSLVIADDGKIADYKLRQKDGKRKVVEALHSVNYEVIAFGDSYNDTSMLKEAEIGFLFRPPQNVIDEFPQFKVANDYGELKKLIEPHLV